MVTSKAIFEPEVDERQLRSESDKVKDAMAEAEELSPEVDTRDLQRQIDQVEGPQIEAQGSGFGGGGRRPGGIGRRAGLGSAAGFGAVSSGGLSSLGGAASKAAIPVALSGAVGFGMLKGIEKVAAASPAFEQQQEMFSAALQNFRAPFGRAIADAIAPQTESLLEASVEFRKAAEEQGLGSAFTDLIGPEVSTFLESENLFERMQAGATVGGITGGIFGGKVGAGLGGALGASLPVFLAPIQQPIVSMAGWLEDIKNNLDDMPGIGQPMDASTLINNPIGAAALVTGTLVAPELVSGTVTSSSLITGTVDATTLITGGVLAADLIGGSAAASSLIAGTAAASSLISGSVSATSLITGGVAAGSLITGGVPVGAIITGSIAISSLLDRNNNNNTGDSTPTRPSNIPVNWQYDPISGTWVPPDTPTPGGPTGPTEPPSPGPGGRLPGGGRIPEPPSGGVTLQSGGIVTGATQATVGEAGREAVLPLDEFFNRMESLMRGQSGGGDQVVDRLESIERELQRLRRESGEVVAEIDGERFMRIFNKNQGRHSTLITD